MTKRKRILTGSAVLLALFCCGALLRMEYLRGLEPRVEAAASVIAADSCPEIRYADAIGCTVQLVSDGEIFWSQLLEQQGGELTAAPLPEGDYQLELHSRRGTLLASDFLTVTGSALFTEEPVSELGALTLLRYDASLLGEDGWIGVYERDALPGEEPAVLWLRAGDMTLPDGLLSAKEMWGDWERFDEEPGDWTAYLFPGSGYDFAASWDFSTVEPDGWVLRWMSAEGQPGSAGGSVTVIGPEGEPEQEALLYWGQGDEPLAGYGPVRALTISGGETHRSLQSGLVIPEGAARLLLYSAREGRAVTLLASMELPAELRTAPEEPLYSFAVLSDTHVTRYPWNQNNRQAAEAFRQAAEEMPGILFAVNNGDVTDNGAEGEYRQLEKLAERCGIDLYLTLGNHDAGKNAGDFSGLLERFLTFAGREKVYARLPEEGNFLLLGSDGPAQDELLTASDAVLREEQLGWLSEQLSASEGPVFIFLHQPLSNTVAGTGKGSDVIPDNLLHSLLDDDPRVFLFTGHTHRALDGSWTVYETDSGGYRIHDGSVCGFCGSSGETEQGSQGLLVEVYEDHLLLRSRDFLADQWMASAFWRLDFAF